MLTGTDFVALEKLRPHEELRDKLIIFDKVVDVKAAMRLGDVFVFISHQWLGFSDPQCRNQIFQGICAEPVGHEAVASTPWGGRAGTTGAGTHRRDDTAE